MKGEVLVSGAGIAGATLAYWLRHRGFTPVLVETAPAFRTGGYMIDFWGVGYDVAERMDLVPALRASGYVINDVLFVDERNRRLGGFEVEVLRRALGGRFFSLLRGDLAHAIHALAGAEIEAIYGDTVVALEETASGVLARFAGAAPRRFDLVVGADGLHSAVRRIVFGPEERFEKYLGYYTASFVTDGYPHRDEDTYLSYARPGRQASRYALRGGRTAIFFVFAREGRLDIPAHDLAAQKKILRDTFGADSWELPEILERLDACDDLYFDSVSQIRMDRWSRGRCALIGDAAYCPSLLAGKGAVLAMAGAYVLAGELERAEGDFGAAVAAYEQRLRPPIEDTQESAVGFAATFAPKTALGLFLRNQALGLMRWPLVARWMLPRMLGEHCDLPSYG